jgi:hypothetical protein
MKKFCVRITLIAALLVMLWVPGFAAFTRYDFATQPASIKTNLAQYLWPATSVSISTIATRSTAAR